MTVSFNGNPAAAAPDVEGVVGRRARPRTGWRGGGVGCGGSRLPRLPTSHTQKLATLPTTVGKVANLRPRRAARTRTQARPTARVSRTRHKPGKTTEDACYARHLGNRPGVT